MNDAFILISGGLLLAGALVVSLRAIAKGGRGRGNDLARKEGETLTSYRARCDAEVLRDIENWRNGR